MIPEQLAMILRDYSEQEMHLLQLLTKVQVLPQTQARPLIDAVQNLHAASAALIASKSELLRAYQLADPHTPYQNQDLYTTAGPIQDVTPELMDETDVPPQRRRKGKGTK